MLFINVNLENKVLFFEHHYIPVESYSELLYFIEQLKLILKNKTGMPKAILLGNTYLFDQNNQLIDCKEINSVIVNHIQDLGIEVFSIDHSQTIIPFNCINRDEKL